MLLFFFDVFFCFDVLHVFFCFLVFFKFFFFAFVFAGGSQGGYFFEGIFNRFCFSREPVEVGLSLFSGLEGKC